MELLPGTPSLSALECLNSVHLMMFPSLHFVLILIVFPSSIVRNIRSIAYLLFF